MTQSCPSAGADLILTVPLPEVLTWAGSGLALLVVGVLLFRNRLPSRAPDFLGGGVGGIGFMLIVYGALLLLVFAPSEYFVERIVVSPSSTCAARGFWFWRQPPLRLEHADIVRLRRTSDAKGDPQLEVRLRDGSLQRKWLPSLWTDNEAQIEAAWRRLGIGSEWGPLTGR